MNQRTVSVLTLFVCILLSGCSDKDKTKSLSENAMQCGPGKCSASMIDGSTVLVKKKTNILDQLKEDDPRRACVVDAETTKEVYNCVRDEATARLSLEMTTAEKAVSKNETSEMKCAPGKCSAGK
ncbi:hypothetical protein PGH07_10055 [Sulfurovum sp. zt1-1]|uniref:Lipoprotein n=1 Tax=Sulfurovum zhangzhouensis TaxID=3019067 RepID=A0ABT7R089_9BACT|nr:hypothetical protein [Sulfurovum zhangzhouensis]MDM5272522.1 hypothetical protein [Sulfurovum zhangzhouensis]